MSAIAELWYGNLNPNEQFGRSNPEMRRLEIYMEKYREELEACLNAEQKALLEQYNNCMDRYIDESNVQAFRDGFGIGCMLLSEAVSDAKKHL